MGETTGISWCDHTFNPWWGCQAVSEACRFCYAEAFAARVGHGKRLPQIWGGASTERRFFGDKHWAEPLKWNRAAQVAGVRRRVFSASMADVFEDRDDVAPERTLLRRLIDVTPWLDWLLLTKRPEDADRLWRNTYLNCEPVWAPNIWLGTTCESQAEAEKRIPHLAAVPAKVKFLSVEPMLGPINLFGPALHDTGPFGAAWIRRGVSYETDYGTGREYDVELTAAVDWVIVGGESGPYARPFSLDWAESIVQQCRAAGVAPFVKQLGSNCGLSLRSRGLKPIVHSHGADPSEWPAELRVQEFPEAS